jgi:HEAT repeat protein
MRLESRILIVVIALVWATNFVWAAAQTQQRSVEGLVYELKHPDADKRKDAAKKLGDSQVRNAVPELVEATKDPDSGVRLEVAKALVKINDSRALGAFTELTRDPDPEVQKVSIQGIVQIYVVVESGFLADMKKVADFMNPLSDGYNPMMVEPYVPVSEAAVTGISDLLFHDDKGIRKDAAVALGILRGQSALPAIQHALEGEQANDVKVELIRAIYKIGDPAGGEALLPLIRDPDKKVHDEAILAAGRLRTKQAVPQLNELYRAGVEERKKVFGLVPVSGTDDLQRKVLEALAYIADPDSKDIFEDALEDSRDHYRRYGAEGLGRIRDESYLGLIARKYLREEKKDVKLAMGYAQYLMGREEHLVELVDNATSGQAFYYMLELDAEQVKGLYPYVQTERDATKIRLLDVIGLKGDMSSMPLVQELSNHENADVASAANLAIRRLNGRFPQG